MQIAYNCAHTRLHVPVQSAPHMHPGPEFATGDNQAALKHILYTLPWQKPTCVCVSVTE